MSTTKTEAKILIDGNELSFADEQILSIIIDKEVNKIPSARFIIRDGNANTQDFPHSDGASFIPGASVEIKIGDPQSKASLFKGIVIQQAIKIRDRGSVLVVECRDESVRLTIGRKSRFFAEKSDSEILTAILNEYSEVNGQGEDSAQIAVHPQMVQYYSSDWDFISMRAEAIGKYLFVEDGNLDMKSPDFSQSPVMTFAYGLTEESESQARIWEFESRMDARNQFSAVNTSSWDYTKQSVEEATSDFSASTEPGNLGSDALAGVISLSSYQLHHLGKIGKPELTAYANSIKQKSLLNKSYGRVKIDGRANLKPGDFITLAGVGERFNGDVFVSRVHHEYEGGRWFTEVLFGLPYEWFYEKPNIPNPNALGLLPAVGGLHIATVLLLKDDQNKEKDFRIKVQIPGIHKDQDGIWCRLASQYAGADHGIVFLPDIGDEVVVGYVDMDVREPVILGSLFSQNNTPPFTNDDNNYLKGWKAKNDHKIHIDEENDLLTIETKENTITLDDANKTLTIKDNHGNTIEMGSSEIKISNNSAITIKTGTLNLEGTEVNIKGEAMTNINSPSGGMVKLGTGAKPVATLGDTVTSLIPGIISPVVNTKVLV